MATVYLLSIGAGPDVNLVDVDNPYTPEPSGGIDIPSIPGSRRVIFEGSLRVVMFEGSKRVVRFDGSDNIAELV